VAGAYGSVSTSAHDGVEAGGASWLSAEHIAVAVGVGRSTLFRYLDKFVDEGVAGLLHREYKGGPVPTLQGADREAFFEQLRRGRFRRAKQAQAWIKARTKTELASRLGEASAGADQPVRLWVLDEHRYGLLPVI
jgi:transposase